MNPIIGAVAVVAIAISSVVFLAVETPNKGDGLSDCIARLDLKSRGYSVPRGYLLIYPEQMKYLKKTKEGYQDIKVFAITDSLALIQGDSADFLVVYRKGQEFSPRVYLKRQVVQPGSVVAEFEPVDISHLITTEVRKDQDCVFPPGKFPKTIRRGYDTEKYTTWYVYTLQEALLAHGEDVIRNSYFTIKTERAVISFQKKHGIPADGIVGEETQKALCIGLFYKPGHGLPMASEAAEKPAAYTH